MRSVVLVHGFASSFESDWRRTGVVEALATAGLEAPPFDLPGHGMAAKPHDPAAYADLDRYVADVLPDGPVDAVGFSLGGATLLRLAIERPGCLRRLVLVGVGESAFRARDSHARLAMALESGAPSDADEELRRFVGFASSNGNDPLALAACVRRPDEPLRVEQLVGVTCPTLVVLGEHDFAGPADRLIAALPDARELVIRGRDHFGTVRSPAFHAAVVAFLSEPTS